MLLMNLVTYDEVGGSPVKSTWMHYIGILTIPDGGCKLFSLYVSNAVLTAPGLLERTFDPDS